MQDQGRSTRKRTGGRLKNVRNRRKDELGRLPTETEVGEPRFRTVDVRGNGTKTRALATNVASVNKGDETVPADIEDVVENDANPNYIRRNIITKGSRHRDERGSSPRPVPARSDRSGHRRSPRGVATDGFRSVLYTVLERRCRGFRPRCRLL